METTLNYRTSTLQVPYKYPTSTEQVPNKLKGVIHIENANIVRLLVAIGYQQVTSDNLKKWKKPFVRYN